MKILILAWLGLSMACLSAPDASADAPKPPETAQGAVRYYLHVNLMLNPARPYKEISKDDLGTVRFYVKATFRADGKLSTYTSVRDGKDSFISTYKYNDKGAAVEEEQRQLLRGLLVVYKFSDDGQKCISSTTAELPKPAGP